MPCPSLDAAGNCSVASWPLGPNAQEVPGRPASEPSTGCPVPPTLACGDRSLVPDTGEC